MSCYIVNTINITQQTFFIVVNHLSDDCIKITNNDEFIQPNIF